jgi:NAD(P)-dependent dehydrogenase (short-subunit alcohol dehydrogenase family)
LVAESPEVAGLRGLAAERGGLLVATPEQLERHWAVNARGTALLAEVARRFRGESGTGRIVNFTSGWSSARTVRVVVRRPLRDLHRASGLGSAREPARPAIRASRRAGITAAVALEDGDDGEDPEGDVRDLPARESGYRGRLATTAAPGTT